jgi:hypothetical protein
MTPLSALWLPIVLSAVAVFVASSIMHMLLPYHRSDYHPLPDEERVLPVLRAAGLKRGLYVFPFTTQKDMKSPAMTEKYNQGPVGMMTIAPNGLPVMPKFLGLWFGYCLLVGLVGAYLAVHTILPGAHLRHVFRVVGTAAFLAYSLRNISNSIWKMQTWSMTIKETIDGIVYALLTAGIFAWLWPQ